MTRVLFFGGNGHASARLDPARRALAAASPPLFELVSVPYPGFERRPRAPTFDAFLDDVAATCAALIGASSVVYATGIGGLLVLALRGRGALRDVPAIFQAPVLWGLEHRWMPRVMRLGLAQVALRRAFASPMFQRRFARKHFLHPPPDEVVRAFFDGYAMCDALPDFFEWLTPSLLRAIEAQHASDPALLDRITFLWGERDTVVPPREMSWTEAALGARIPVTTLPEWGHYPMIDDPDGWVREVSRVASAATIR
ncbi:MAG: alpha/beta hydrolase [Polyangiaceae bacterium]